MQLVAAFDIVIGVKVIPTLAARFLSSAVPGNRQRLKPPAFQRKEVLLQRINPENVANRKTLGQTVRPLGCNPEPIGIPGECGDSAVIGEGSPIKISQHGLRSSLLHCEIVVRILPGGECCLMTGCANLGPDKP